ncbi:protein-methionine-sulfoxide reductase catalytic subunit MsrP [Flexithrix dorotheae]|uniref:protein-methionine-sulfoxide reductase catalytic subunit MsrP n=1 Tax=Flexithrix dorotheae TaxID=70993 RepID=UPI0003660EA9|nr:protein-methionine-sulfoxide reductase catalytic subunit MsrP [Flexithrix dorotheae]
MANIKISKPWEDKNLKVTDEKVYANRRETIKKLGLVSSGIIMSPLGINNSCQNAKNESLKEEGKSIKALKNVEDNHFSFEGMMDLYPAARNEKYKLDRELTEEYDATHHNNFYEFIHPDDKNIYNVYKYIEDFDNRDWTIKVSGKVKNKGKYLLEDIIKKIGLEERLYRFRCVERWSMAVPWTGFPLSSLIKIFEPENDARFIRMVTYANPNEMPGVKNQTWYPWPYVEGLRMDEAMNELAFIATGIYGKPLPKQNGAPMRLVVPWKYGYKNIKSIVKMEFLKNQPETFWHKIQPSEYPFISNVDPVVPHPRWSQAYEKMIPDGETIPTLKYNGYGAFVGKLYS